MNKKIIPLKASSAAKISTAYVIKVLKSKKFNEYVKLTRKTFMIPTGGFASTEEAKDKLKKADFDELEHIISRLCVPFSIDPQVYGEYVLEYVLYGVFETLPTLFISGGGSLCKLSIADISKEDLSDDEFLYPVHICISPYLTKSALLDFIKTNYYAIESAQKELSNPVTSEDYKVRTSYNIIRDSYIFRNRKMPHKELFEKVNQHFDGLSLSSVTDIAKIISKEKKLRK